MNNPVKKDSITLDGTFLKNHPSRFEVINLRTEQLEKIHGAYENRRLENIGNLGWVNPENILNYYCSNCSKNYNESPKLEITINDDSSFAQGALICNYCNEVLGFILTEKNDEMLEKKYFVRDESGKFIKFTKEFIDEEISREIRMYDFSNHLIDRFHHKINRWIGKARTIGYELDKKNIYSRVKKETIEKTISMIGSEDIIPTEKTFSILKEIIKSIKNNNLNQLLEQKQEKAIIS